MWSLAVCNGVYPPNDNFHGEIDEKPLDFGYPVFRQTHLAKFGWEKTHWEWIINNRINQNSYKTKKSTNMSLYHWQITHEVAKIDHWWCDIQKSAFRPKLSQQPKFCHDAGRLIASKNSVTERHCTSHNPRNSLWSTGGLKSWFESLRSFYDEQWFIARALWLPEIPA